MSGFAVLPNAIVRDPTLGLAEKGALLVLSGYAGADNGAFPSIATIAKAIGKSERQTKRIMTALAESGYVTKKTRHDPETGARRSTLYHLNFDRWGGAVVQRTDLSRAKGQICHGPSDTGDTGAGDKSDTPPVTPVSPITRTDDQDQTNKGSDPSDLHRAAWAAWQAHLGSDSRTRQHRTRDGLPQSKELRALLSSFVNSDRGRDFDSYFRYLASVNPWGWFDGSFAVNIDWATRPATRKKVAAQAYQQAKAASAEDNKQARLEKFDGWLNDKGMYG